MIFLSEAVGIEVVECVAPIVWQTALNSLESPKHVVEHAIHFAMQRKERMHVGSTLEADLAASVVPG